MQAISAKRMRPIREEVYERLRNGILMGEYAPGDWMREEEVSRALGVSRMPVREAFRKLEMDGFLNYIPNRGTMISEVFTDDLADIYDGRIFLECRLARKAAKNITEEQLETLRANLEKVENTVEGAEVLRLTNEFNETLFAASQSPSLVLLARAAHALIVRIRYHNHLNPDRRKDSWIEHRDIYEALRDRDPDRAEEATQRHLESSKHFSLSQIRKANQSL